MWLGKGSQRLGAEEIRGRKTLPMVSACPLRSPELRVYGTVDRWEIGALNIWGGRYVIMGFMLAILGS